MRVIFDHSIPRGIAWSLKGHEVSTAVELGWESISNGKLLSAETARKPGNRDNRPGKPGETGTETSIPNAPPSKACPTASTAHGC
jgi:hypothetical protein